MSVALPPKPKIPTTRHSAPFDLLGFDHVAFYIDDMAKALDHYGRVLGYVLGYSYPDIGMEQLWCGANLIVGWDLNHPATEARRSWAMRGQNVDHLCIATGPIDPVLLRAHMKGRVSRALGKPFTAGLAALAMSFMSESHLGTRSNSKAAPFS